MNTRRAVRTVLAAAAVPAFAFATATTASAAQGYDLATLNGGTFSGHAEANGNVTFHSARSFTVNISRLADVCDGSGGGDGAGAYLFVRAETANGTDLFLQDNDSSGCSDGNVAGADIGYTASANVRRVRIEIRECDNRSTGLFCSINSRDIANSTWKDNPNVG